MALIGKIRNNSWILIIAIALGLGGFLIMDMVSAGQGPGGGLSQLVVGNVNGEKIRRTEFERVYSLRYNGSNLPTYQNRNALWDWFVEDQLLREEAEAIGLGVSDAEVAELEFGANPSPIIRRNFPNPQQPGAINRQQLDYFKGLIDNGTLREEIDNGRLSPQFPDFWKMQREMIKKDRLQSKLQALVQKGMYTPTWMAEMGAAENNQKVDFTFVNIPYDKIPNGDVQVSDSDLKDYLQANAARYNRTNEERVLDYVVFDVVPTAADSAVIRQEMKELAIKFENAENDSNFVMQYEGIITPAYSSTEDLSSDIADTVMAMPVGSVYGPYVEQGEYRLVKVIDRAVMADSADTRHILLSATTPDQFAEVSERGDSIINLLNAGTTPFDSLVVAFSEDPGSSNNGGKYEGVTPNQFVPEFNRVLFITGVPGTYYKVRTSYGIHIVEILSRTAATTQRAQVAYLREAIVPSKETQDNIFQDASQFAAQNGSVDKMRAAAEQSANMRVVSTPPFDKNAYNLGELGFSNDTKDAICWAFSADEGEVSPSIYSFTDQVRYYDDKYVVVGLSDILEPGTPSIEEIRTELEAEVLAAKKADMVNEAISGMDLQAIASKYGVQVDTVKNLSFSSPSAPGLGSEPKVVAKAVVMAQGQTSGAIQGQGGIFALQVTNKSTPAQATNLPQIRQQMNRTAQGNVASSFMTLFRQGADVEDNRATYECN